MLWLKAFHIIGVVSWFAALLYLPRLFVYHAQIQGASIDDDAGNARFKVMERKLFMIMTIGAVLATVFGVSLLLITPGFMQMGWLHAKLTLVALLIGYHLWCYRLIVAFRDGTSHHSERWYRLFNEAPSLLLIAIVVLVVVKPF